MFTAVIRSTVLAAALVAPFAVAPAALAGGAPDYPVGQVSVDPIFTLVDGTLDISGSYWCQGAGERIGSFFGEVRDRENTVITTFAWDSLACDGEQHAWGFAMEQSGVHPGRLFVDGMIQVCESVDGPCPGVLFEQDVMVRPAR